MKKAIELLEQELKINSRVLSDKEWGYHVMKGRTKTPRKELEEDNEEIVQALNAIRTAQGFIEEKDSYMIAASKDGKEWDRITQFEQGQKSRWGTPFDANVAIREAEGFKKARYDKYKFVRLVIDV